jgi:hypothetical protein
LQAKRIVIVVGVSRRGKRRAVVIGRQRLNKIDSGVQLTSDRDFPEDVAVDSYPCILAKQAAALTQLSGVNVTNQCINKRT